MSHGGLQGGYLAEEEEFDWLVICSQDATFSAAWVGLPLSERFAD
jgi:hypothetical protein